MYCPGGNATDPIWRVLASSDGISFWTPLKPQHSNPNTNTLANQLWCIDFLTPPIPFIIPHRLAAFLESFIPLKNWCTIHARCSKSSLKHSICFCGIFSSLKQNFIAYRSSKVSDYISENHQLWQSGFSRVYSNCCCSCLFEAEIIKICQSAYKMYSNNILIFQGSTTILNAWTKKVWKLIICTSYQVCIDNRTPNEIKTPFIAYFFFFFFVIISILKNDDMILSYVSKYSSILYCLRLIVLLEILKVNVILSFLIESTRIEYESKV